MSRWFRFYDDAINDPKVQRLDPKMFKAWVNLLCLASKNDGWFPPIEDVCFSLRMSEMDAGRIVDGLISSGLIDDIDGRFCPHNWRERQFKSDVSNERVKRFRERKCNVTDTVTVTPPETEQIQITEAEQKETREVALSDDWPADYENRFWAAWPNPVGKKPAMKALASARKRRCSFVAIMGGMDNYIRDKPPDRQWMNPTTFLNQNRWEDQPAQVTNAAPKRSGSLLDAIDRRLAALAVEGEPDTALPAYPVLRISN